MVVTELGTVVEATIQLVPAEKYAVGVSIRWKDVRARVAHQQALVAETYVIVPPGQFAPMTPAAPPDRPVVADNAVLPGKPVLMVFAAQLA